MLSVTRINSVTHQSKLPTDVSTSRMMGSVKPSMGVNYNVFNLMSFTSGLMLLLSLLFSSYRPVIALNLIGEKLDALEPFLPERVAQRILGMGDVLSLVEEVERKIDKEKAEKMAKNCKKAVASTLKIC